MRGDGLRCCMHGSVWCCGSMAYTGCAEGGGLLRGGAHTGPPIHATASRGGPGRGGEVVGGENGGRGLWTHTMRHTPCSAHMLHVSYVVRCLTGARRGKGVVPPTTQPGRPASSVSHATRWAMPPWHASSTPSSWLPLQRASDWHATCVAVRGTEGGSSCSPRCARIPRVIRYPLPYTSPSVWRTLTVYT